MRKSSKEPFGGIPLPKQENEREQRPTVRPLNEAMEALIGTTFRVHNHGFVRVVDYMGNDRSIVQAARVSTGNGSKGDEADARLIDYLMKNRHTSPFEQCLGGDTRIPTFPCRGAKVEHYTIREIAEAWNDDKGGSWTRLIYIRTADPKTGIISRTKIRRAWKSGAAQTFKVTVARLNRSIIATGNHPFLCSDGAYRQLDELRVGDKVCLGGKRETAETSVLEEVVYEEISSIEPAGEQGVYDIEVESENHNFVAEGFVVHNCEVKLHLKMPIFVARQWIRHRTANVNEMSGRYSVLPEEFYEPVSDYVKGQSSTNKQASSGELPAERINEAKNLLHGAAEHAFRAYNEMLEEDFGVVARETARMGLPLSTYTEFFWKIDLHNLFHFLKLRNHEHAQREIRDYAIIIDRIVRQWVPMAYEAWRVHVKDVATFSAKEIEAIYNLLHWLGDLVPNELSEFLKRKLGP